MGKKDGLVRQRGKEKMYQNCLERYTHRYLAIKHFPLKEITQDTERQYIYKYIYQLLPIFYNHLMTARLASSISTKYHILTSTSTILFFLKFEISHDQTNADCPLTTRTGRARQAFSL